MSVVSCRAAVIATSVVSCRAAVIATSVVSCRAAVDVVVVVVCVLVALSVVSIGTVVVVDFAVVVNVGLSVTGVVVSSVVVVAVVVVVVVGVVVFSDATTIMSTGPGSFRNLRNLPVSFFVSSDRNSVICFSNSSFDFGGTLCSCTLNCCSTILKCTIRLPLL